MANWWDDLTPVNDTQAAAAPNAWGLVPVAEGETPATLSKPEEVRAAPKQDTSLLRYPRMIGNEAMAGFGTVLGLPGSIQRLTNAGINTLLPEGQRGPPAVGQLPVEADVADWLGRRGIGPKADVMPQTPGEHAIVGAARGLGAALPLLPASPAASLPTLAAGIGAGAASELLGPAAGTAVGLLTGGAGSAATRAVNALAGRVSPLAATLEAAGLPNRTAAMTSESPLVRGALASAAPAAEIEQDFVKSLGESAASLGTSRTYEEAGRVAQARARDWIENIKPVKQEAAWAPVNAAIASDTPTGLSEFANAVRSITTSGGRLAPVEKLLRPQLPERIKETLFGKLADDASLLPPPRPQAAPTVTPGGGMNPPTRGAAPAPGGLRPMGTAGVGEGPVDWSDAWKLQKTLGDAMHNPQITKDVGEQNLARLYAALSSDRRKVAEASGVADAFDSANAESTRLHAFQSNVIDKEMFSSANPAQESIQPGDVTKSFLSSGRLAAGGSHLAQLNEELPDVTREFAAAKLAKIAGLDDPSTPKESVSKGFSREWQAMSPEAKSALFEAAPTTHARLNATYAASKLVPNTSPGSKLASVAGHGFSILTGLELGREGLGLLGHEFLGAPSTSLIPGEAGAFLGAAGPLAAWMAKARLANSPGLAAYAGSLRPGGNAFIPVASLVGATEPSYNPLAPKP